MKDATSDLPPELVGRLVRITWIHDSVDMWHLYRVSRVSGAWVRLEGQDDGDDEFIGGAIWVRAADIDLLEDEEQ
jgi:hypothetical protein